MALKVHLITLSLPHSYGAAHAILFGMYLRETSRTLYAPRHGMTAQVKYNVTRRSGCPPNELGPFSRGAGENLVRCGRDAERVRSCC